MAQEALHNVAKHAKATAVSIALRSLSADGTWLELRVTDNGTGFDPQKVPPGHMGLGTMRQRVEALGGEYRIQSGPGGTSVCVRVPLSGTSS